MDLFFLLIQYVLHLSLFGVAQYVYDHQICHNLMASVIVISESLYTCQSCNKSCVHRHSDSKPLRYRHVPASKVGRHD